MLLEESSDGLSSSQKRTKYRNGKRLGVISLFEFTVTIGIPIVIMFLTNDGIAGACGLTHLLLENRLGRDSRVLIIYDRYYAC